MLGEQKKQMDEENKRKLEESRKRASEESRKLQEILKAQEEESRKQAREEAQKLQEILKAKEAKEHDLKFKNGKIFKPSLKKSNVKEVKLDIDFIKESLQEMDPKIPLDGEWKENIGTTFNNINRELKVINEEIGGIEKCLRLEEKSPRINYEQEAKNLQLAQGLVKGLEGYKAELCNLLASRRKELNHPELEAAYREKATLHEAALAGDLDLVQKIVSRGISVQLPTQANQTALHYVALTPKPNIAVAEWLAQKGGRSMIDVIDNQGNTALSIAVERGHWDLIKLLVKFGASLNFKHPKNWSLLHLAAYHGQLAVVKYLVEEANISPLTFDAEGNTALILALGNKHEAVVSYLRGKTDLPTFYAMLKEDVTKRFSGRLATHVKEICEYTSTDPAHVNLDNLIDGFVETMQAIVKKGESAYVIPVNMLKQDSSQERGSALQPKVRGVLQDLLNELKRYSPNLPESSQRELDKLTVENLQPQITAIVRRINKVKEDVTSFAQEQAKQSQERIEKMHAATEKLQQQMQQLEQQVPAKEEAQKKGKSQRQYVLAIKNIAVPSMKDYFIPSLRSSNVEEISKDMEFIRENITQNPINTPLTIEQQKNLQLLLKQIAKEEQKLTISYRDLKNLIEHRGEAFLQEIQKEAQENIQEIKQNAVENQDEKIRKIQKEAEEKLEKAIQEIVKNLTEDTKAAELEASMIKRRCENTKLAKQLLEELQLIKKEAYEILKNNKEDVSKYIGATQYEANFENDYSNQALVDYIGSYGLEDPYTKSQLNVAFLKDRLIEAVEKEQMGKVIVDRAVLEQAFKKAYQLAEKAQPDLELTVQFFEALKKYWVLELQNTLLESSSTTKMDIGEVFSDVYRKTAQTWNEEAQKEQAFIATLRDMFQNSTVAILRKLGTQEPVNKSYIQAILQAIPLKAHIEKYYPSHQVISYRDRHSYVTGLVLHSLLTAVPVSLAQTIQHKKLNDVKKQVHRLHPMFAKEK